MVNGSIERAIVTGNADYYMDFMKLHKLMYIGQCYMLARYGRSLFDEKVEAHFCGPYVDGISFIQGSRGFGLIDTPFDEKDFLRPTLFRSVAIEWVLQHFGKESTESLMEFTKETLAYMKAETSLTDNKKPIIAIKDMGKSLVSVRRAV